MVAERSSKHSWTILTVSGVSRREKWLYWKRSEDDPPDTSMAMRLNPTGLSKCITYERYRQELKAWQEVRNITKIKPVIAIALSLPQDSGESGIKEKVFEQIELRDLNKENGLEILINFLDKTIGKDDLSDSWEHFENFEDYYRGQNETILDYVSRFDQKCNRHKGWAWNYH